MLYSLFVFCGLSAAGQEAKRWSLQECIDYAVENNIELRQKRISGEQGEVDLWQLKGELFPSLSFSTTQSIDYRPLQESVSNIVTNGIATSSDNKFSYNGSYGLNASWTVFNGGANVKNIKAQRLQNRITELSVAESANSIEEQIMQLYVQILYSKDALKVDRAILETSESQYERGCEMFEVGLFSKVDLVQLESQAASARYDCVSMEVQIADFKRQLKQLLEITDDAEFDIADVDSSDDVVMELIPSVAEVYQRALECRPEIESGRLGVEAADLNIDIAKAGYFPTISINAGLGESHNSQSSDSFDDQMRQNFDMSAGVSLSIPLFDNRKNRSNVKKAKLSKTDSELQLLDEQIKLYGTIEEFWLNANSNQQKYVAAVAKVNSAQLSYDLLDEQFKNGLKNIVELLDGRDELLSAQQDRLQSKYNTLLNVQLLRFYQGESVEF